MTEPSPPSIMTEAQVLAMWGDPPTLIEALRRWVSAAEQVDYFASAPETLDRLALHLNDTERALLGKLAAAAVRVDDAEMAAAITEERFRAEREPRFGTANPERMELPFWEFMVRKGWIAYEARRRFDPTILPYINDEPDAKYKWGSAVWCWSRFGQTQTLLPNGSTVYIGGEHEDWYDPDFHIYNDVVVIDRNLNVRIYGYPREVLRPTDFHTATLVGEGIYIVGCLGYFGTQPLGETPVLRLDTTTFAIEPVATTGRNPGWIYQHETAYVPERHALRITKGKVLRSFTRKENSKANRRTYWLDLNTNEWSVGRGQ